jgi:hypothetical protein
MTCQTHWEYDHTDTDNLAESKKFIYPGYDRRDGRGDFMRFFKVKKKSSFSFCESLKPAGDRK